MRARDGLTRGVLIVAALTTIATSALQDHEREDIESHFVMAPGVFHVVVRLNEAANEQAEAIAIEFSWFGQTPTVMVVPDDPAQPPFQLTGVQTLIVTDGWCGAGPCELGFSIDPGATANNGELQVRGQITREADQSFCFPENRDFSPDATIDVAFE